MTQVHIFYDPHTKYGKGGLVQYK